MARVPGKAWIVFFALVSGTILLPQARADVQGCVVDDETDAGLPDVRVHFQTEPEPFAITNQQGCFSLTLSPGHPGGILAGAVPYDAAREEGSLRNYTTGGTQVLDGENDVEIRLEPIPTENNTGYVPIAAQGFFSCSDCHQAHVDEWATSAHSGAATNPWVLDLYSGSGTAGGGEGYVFRDSHPESETGLCAVCHSPIGDFQNPGTAYLDEVSGTSALEGVTCTACHTIHDLGDDPQAFHLIDGAKQRFPMTELFGLFTAEHVWGPLDDVTYGFMRPAYAPYFEESRFCASCHEYADEIGQKTYSEWLESPYAQAGPSYRTCQNCHMPQASTDGPIAVPNIGQPFDRPAAQRHSHTFPGATPDRVRGAIQLEVELSQVGSEVQVVTSVINSGAGHSFPTGISMRNVVLVVDATLNGIPLTQTSGPTVPDWADDSVPGKQTGDWGGFPGFGYARILEGQIADQGELLSPVLFIDADRALSNTTIASGTTDQQTFRFSLDARGQLSGEVEVFAQLLYRRAFRSTVVTKGWSTTPQGYPWEIEVAQVTENLQVATPTATPSGPTATATPTGPTPTRTPTGTATTTPTGPTPTATPTGTLSMVPIQTGRWPVFILLLALLLLRNTGKASGQKHRSQAKC